MLLPATKSRPSPATHASGATLSILKVLVLPFQVSERTVSLRNAETIRLLGSVARDEATPDSDVDLLVQFEHTPTFSGFMKLRIFLEDLLGRPVDLVTESGLRDQVRPYVEKDAIRVA